MRFDLLSLHILVLLVISLMLIMRQFPVGKASSKIPVYLDEERDKE